jgi:hypothetical protein
MALLLAPRQKLCPHEPPLTMASAVKLGPNSVASWLNQDDRLTTLSSGLFAAFLLFYLFLVLSAISDKAINLKRAWNHPGLYQMESLGRHYQKARALIVGLENFSKDELEEAQRFLADRLKQDSKFDDSVFGGISRMGITPALVLAFLSQGGIHKYISEGPSFATFAVLFYITFLVYALVLKLNTSSLKRYAFLLDEAIIRKSSKPRYLDANR